MVLSGNPADVASSGLGARLGYAINASSTTWQAIFWNGSSGTAQVASVSYLAGTIYRVVAWAADGGVCCALEASTNGSDWAPVHRMAIAASLGFTAMRMMAIAGNGPSASAAGGSLVFYALGVNR